MKLEPGKRKQILILIAAIIVIALIALGVQSRVGGKQKELAQSFENLLTAESVHTNTELVINLPQRLRNIDRPFTTITARVEGDVKQAPDSTPELSGTLLIEAKGRGNVFFADGDVRILKDEVLFNLENLPVFLNPTGSLVKKWTKVDASLLTTANGEQVKEALASTRSAVMYVGRDDIDGQKLLHYHGQLSAEQEEQLVEVLRQSVSGNPALGVLVRLMRANNVDAFDIWVDASKREIRQVTAHFARPLSDGGTFDFAFLTMEFRNYNSEVAIDRPTAALTVPAGVFARIFGSGEVEALQPSADN